MDVRLFESVRVVDDHGLTIDLGPRKQRALFTLLALHVNELVPTDRILEALWGEDAFDKEQALWVVISRLRTALEPSRARGSEGTLIRTREGGYSLIVPADAVDVHRFEQAVEAARRADEPRQRRTESERAIAIARGPVGGEFAHEDFVADIERRRRTSHLEVHEIRAEAAIELGDGRAEITDLERLLAENPLRDRLAELHATALYQAGRQADALRSITNHRARLADELGIEPSRTLVGLEEQILLHDPDLATSNGPEIDGRNPYLGLRAFDETDASVFHGRDQLIDSILSRMRTHPLTAVVGASGSGKSSVVRAGVMATLRQHGLDDRGVTLATMVPGAHPTSELEAALGASQRLLEDGAPWRPPSDDDPPLVVVIDQFEELYTLPTATERDTFVDQLVQLLRVADTKIVLTLRADFYDRPLADARLAELVSDGTVSVTPMTPEELEATATIPAAAAGVRIEPAALISLIAEVAAEPAALPMYQFTLTDLFDRADDGVMTKAVYDELGGIAGAVGRRAEELFRRLDPDGREAARQLFERLITGHDAGVTRRRVSATELLSLPIDPVAVRSVIDTFGRERLLTFDRDQTTGQQSVEVAHEALLEAWPRLRQWIHERREDLVQLAALRSLTDDWITGDRSIDYLLTGDRLAGLERWVNTTTLGLTDDEAALIEASTAHRDEVAEAEATRQSAEVRRLRRLLVVAIGCLVVAVVAGGFAIDRQRRAADRASAAEAAADLAAAQGLAATAVVTSLTDPYLALALAAEATDIVKPPPTEAVRSLVVARASLTDGNWRPLGPDVTVEKTSVHAVVWDPSGTDLLVVGRSFDAGPATIDRHDLSGGGAVTAFDGAATAAVAIDRTGERIAIAETDQLRVIDAGTGSIITERQVERTNTTQIVFSPDGQRVATAELDGTVIIWNASDLTPIRETTVDDVVLDLGFDATSQQLAITGGPADLLPTGVFRRRGVSGHVTVVGSSGPVMTHALDGVGNAVAWVADTAVAVVDQRLDGLGSVRLVQLGTDGTSETVLDSSIRQPTDLLSTSDSLHVAAIDGIDEWNLANGSRVASWGVDRGGQPVWHLAQIGDRLVAAERDGVEIRLWTRATGGDAPSTIAADGPIAGIESVGDGLWAIDRTGTLFVIDPDDSASHQRLTTGLNEPTATTTDAERFFVGTADGAIYRIEPDGTPVRIAELDGAIAALHVADGVLAAAVGRDVTALDPASGDTIASFGVDDQTLPRRTPFGLRDPETREPILTDDETTATDVVRSVHVKDDQIFVGTLLGRLIRWDPAADTADVTEVDIDVGSIVDMTGGSDVLHLLSAGGDVVTLVDGEVQTSRRGERGPGGQLVASADLRVTLAVGEGGAGQIRDAATGQPIGPALEAPGGASITAAAFAAGGNRFATGGRDGTIAIWDLLDASSACTLAADQVTEAELDDAISGRDATLCPAIWG